MVPDMLGYGGTDKPLAAEEYSTKKLCADLAGLLDVIGVSKAVSVRLRGDFGCTRGTFNCGATDNILTLDHDRT